MTNHREQGQLRQDQSPARPEQTPATADVGLPRLIPKGTTRAELENYVFGQLQRLVATYDLSLSPEQFIKLTEKIAANMLGLNGEDDITQRNIGPDTLDLTAKFAKSMAVVGQFGFSKEEWFKCCWRTPNNFTNSAHTFQKNYREMLAYLTKVGRKHGIPAHEMRERWKQACKRQTSLFMTPLSLLRDNFEVLTALMSTVKVREEQVLAAVLRQPQLFCLSPTEVREKFMLNLALAARSEQFEVIYRDGIGFKFAEIATKLTASKQLIMEQYVVAELEHSDPAKYEQSHKRAYNLYVGHHQPLIAVLQDMFARAELEPAAVRTDKKVVARWASVEKELLAFGRRLVDDPRLAQQRPAKRQMPQAIAILLKTHQPTKRGWQATSLTRIFGALTLWAKAQPT